MQDENPYAAPMQPNYSQQPPAPQQPKSHKLLLIILALTTVLFLVLFAVNLMALNSERSNRDSLVQQEVENLKPGIEADLQAKFDEKAKLPLATYKAPSQHGSIVLKYPKTWSATVDTEGSRSAPFSFTAHPGVVPVDLSAYALRAELVNEPYSEHLSDYNKGIERGEIKSRSFNNSGAQGVRLDGSIDKFNGAMVLLPLREKTLRIWTESTSYNSDFQKVLDNLKFEP